MKKQLIKQTLPPLLACVLFLIACTGSPDARPNTEIPTDDILAKETLTAFLENLNAGLYEQADLLYGGSYETLVDFNPDIDPNDHAGLLDRACTINGIQCLQPNQIQLAEKISDNEFIFEVAFLKADGTPFKLGPCCGSEEAYPATQSVFIFTVKKLGPDQFVVMSMPPYQP